jgi:hypothetical protein
VRIHGTRALAENGRGSGEQTVLLVTVPGEGSNEEQKTTLHPSADECPPEAAGEGLGSADWHMMRNFAAALTSGENPEQDVLFEVAASITGIQAMRSLTEGSIPGRSPISEMRPYAPTVRETIGTRIRSARTDVWRSEDGFRLHFSTVRTSWPPERAGCW